MVGMYDGIDVKITNADKVMYPRDGITKGDVIDYYAAIAPIMLPHIRDRPVSMLRYPDGIDGPSFYHKDVSRGFPGWFDTVTVKKKDGELVHPLCRKTADLVFLANLACLTPHVWLSTVGSLDKPDRMILDMDPGGPDFSVVKDAALSAARHIRDRGLEPYLMTTGSRGLHVTVPLDRTATFVQTIHLAEEVARTMVEEDQRFTTERVKEKREGRLLIDFFRNSYAQTGVAPYALRARDGAPVATPLWWSELDDPDLGPQSYNISNILERVRRHGDPWKDMAEHAGSVTRGASMM
jgi:bifunctional non-homologous end joining protein LigD